MGNPSHEQLGYISSQVFSGLALTATQSLPLRDLLLKLKRRKICNITS